MDLTGQTGKYYWTIKLVRCSNVRNQHRVRSTYLESSRTEPLLLEEYINFILWIIKWIRHLLISIIHIQFMVFLSLFRNDFKWNLSIWRTYFTCDCDLYKKSLIKFKNLDAFKRRNLTCAQIPSGVTFVHQMWFEKQWKWICKIK